MKVLLSPPSLRKRWYMSQLASSHNLRVSMFTKGTQRFKATFTTVKDCKSLLAVMALICRGMLSHWGGKWVLGEVLALACDAGWVAT